MNDLDRILELLKSRGITGKKFTEDLGLNKSVISEWKSGKTKSYEKYIGEIANYLNVSADYLLTGQKGNASFKDAVKVKFNEYIPIPVVGSVSAGYGYFVGETMDISCYELASPELIKSGYDYVYIKVSGDSMEPLLMEDDLVLVEVRNDVYDGDYVVAIVENDEGIIKRFETCKNGFSLISINPYYPKRSFVEEDTERVHIVGKVIEVKRKFF